MNVQIHVDLDNLWMYESEYGVEPQGGYERLYTEAVPELLRVLSRHRAKATLFVIGRDLDEIPDSRDALRAAVAEGHEIANHTYSHPPLSRLGADDKRREVVRCHESIERHLGTTPVGFRAAGCYLDAEILRILSELGYAYDSSVLPGFACQLMRLYMRLGPGAKIGKKFGRHRYLFASPNPTRIALPAGRELVEVPIATMPILRMPIHTTFAYEFGVGFFDLAARMLLRRRRPFVFLLHGIDTLASPDGGPLSKLVVPMRWPLSKRLTLLERILGTFRGLTRETTRELLARQMWDPAPSRLFAHAAGG